MKAQETLRATSNKKANQIQADVQAVLTANKPILKKINDKIGQINSRVGSIRTFAFEALTLALDYGDKTRHYDSIPNILNACITNASLVVDLKAEFAGKVPHSVHLKNGVYVIGKRDESQLMTPEQLQEHADTLAKNRAKVADAAKKRNADNKAKIALADSLPENITSLASDNAALQNRVDNLVKQLNANDSELQQVHQVKDENKALKLENQTLKAELVEANSQIAQLQAIIADMQAAIEAEGYDVKIAA